MSPIREDAPATANEMISAIQKVMTPSPDKAAYLESFQAELIDLDRANEEELARYYDKMENFESIHQEDVFIGARQKAFWSQVFSELIEFKAS